MSDFRVLTVCRANYCRSPIAQVMLQVAADEALGAGGWTVASAGVDVRFDADMHPLARQVLTDRDLAAPPHRTHQMTPADLIAADLILTASRSHRSAVVTMLPAAIGRTFTLQQFARLARAVGPLAGQQPRDAGLSLLREAKLARADVPPVEPELEDLADPIGRPLAAFAACADTVAQAVARIVGPLGRTPDAMD